MNLFQLQCLIKSICQWCVSPLKHPLPNVLLSPPGARAHWRRTQHSSESQPCTPPSPVVSQAWLTSLGESNCIWITFSWPKLDLLKTINLRSRNILRGLLTSWASCSNTRSPGAVCTSRPALLAGLPNGDTMRTSPKGKSRMRNATAYYGTNLMNCC